MTYVSGGSPCYRCLFPDVPEEAITNCATAGVLGVLPGVMGAIQAAEAIKWITGIGELLLGRLLTYDALAMQWTRGYASSARWASIKRSAARLRWSLSA